MSFRTVQQALTEKQQKLKKLLDIPDDEERAKHAQEMQDRITDYFRQTGARLKLDNIKRVCFKLVLQDKFGLQFSCQNKQINTTTIVKKGIQMC